MRVELRKLLEQLGVNHMLSPYETQPWFFHDEAKGQTCSAEVRMGPNGLDIEAEIQMLTDETDGEAGSASGGGGMPQQIMLMHAKPGLGGDSDLVTCVLARAEVLQRQAADPRR